MFDLVAGEESAAPVYALKFSYPNEKKAETAEAGSSRWPPRRRHNSATMTADKLHFDWNTKGNGKLLPTRVFDDGASLYLAWDKETPLPAILTQSEDRKEGPVNYRMSGEYIVISPIPANIVLRYGSKFARCGHRGGPRQFSRQPRRCRRRRGRRRSGDADQAAAGGGAGDGAAQALPDFRATAGRDFGQAGQHDLALQRQADRCRP